MQDFGQGGGALAGLLHGAVAQGYHAAHAERLAAQSALSVAEGADGEDLAPGLRAFEIQVGYMEVIDLEDILRENGVQEKTIFYGVEDIATDNPIWKLFATLKRQTPNFVQFYRIPAAKLQGVVTRVEM